MFSVYVSKFYVSKGTDIVVYVYVCTYDVSIYHMHHCYVVCTYADRV